MRTFIVVLLALLSLSLQSQTLPEVLACGTPGSAGGLAAGDDLFRRTVDTDRYPDAICNDGSPGVFFVRPHAREEDGNKWLIVLQGGGACRDADSCARRWCSAGTNFGMDKMTSTGTKRMVRGSGILSQRPDNPFASWNVVLVYYCSSDHWAGTSSSIPMTMVSEQGQTIDYVLHAQGSAILDAVIDILRKEHIAVRRRATTRPGSEEGSQLPDLDHATHVLLAGSSAGGGGVRNNADRLGDLLRQQNESCSPESCPLVYKALIDASFNPRFDETDFATSTFCEHDPSLCTYESFFLEEWSSQFLGGFRLRGDGSCVEWHQTHEPGSEWRCADSIHVLTNHLTTPMFIHQDLQDQLLRGNFVDSQFGTTAEFGQRVESQMNDLAMIDVTAEEGSSMSGSPAMTVPGVFGPQCEHHESLTSNQPWFNVEIARDNQSASYVDAVWTWWTDTGPSHWVVDFEQPGARQDCP